jgi:hypothetical protein
MGASAHEHDIWKVVWELVGRPAAGSGGCLLQTWSAVQLRPALWQRACQLCTMVLVVVHPGHLAAESA